MTLQSTLEAGRRSAEALMTATCVITRKKLVNLNTGTLLLTDDDPSDDIIYQGPCRIRSATNRVQTADFEGQLLAEQLLTLALPVATSGAVQVGDMVEIIDGGDDPSSGRVGGKVGSGLQLRIQARPAQTQATAHRFPVGYLE